LPPCIHPYEFLHNSDGFLRSTPGQPAQDLNFAFGRLRLYAPGTGSVDKIEATSQAVTGIWTHYAVTRDGTGALKIYVNGALDATARSALMAPFNIGLLGQTSAGVSNARFDDIRIWSVARSGSQIASGMTGYVDPASAGLERLYRFDDSSTEVRDYTRHSAPAALATGVTTVTSDAWDSGSALTDG